MAKKKVDSIVIRDNLTPVVRNSGRVIPYEEKEVLEVITKTNCKLCQCKFREEAEKEFEKTNNYKAIANWLTKEKKFEVSYPAIRNHMLYHFKGKQRKEFLNEYAKDVEKWVNLHENKVDALNSRIAILDREMVTIAAEGDDLPLDERRKNAETVKKIADTILVYESKLHEYEAKLEPVQIVMNQLQVIVTDEIKNMGSDEVKRALVTVLERLHDSVGDMVIEQRK
jgi:hypothetical protein